MFNNKTLHQIILKSLLLVMFTKKNLNSHSYNVDLHYSEEMSHKIFFFLLLALFLFFVVFKKIINFFLTIEMGKKIQYAVDRVYQKTLSSSAIYL